MKIALPVIGFLMAFICYAAFFIFAASYILKALTWWIRGRFAGSVFSGSAGLKPLVFSLADILLLRRLFNVNPGLWFGEWLFHGCIVLIALRHLRFILDPAPLWLESLQTPGLIAGYLLPFSLLYIMTAKFLIGGKKYVPTANFVLLIIFLLISVSGFLMRFVFLADIIAVKEFVSGIFAFAPAPFPESLVFGAHFSLFIILVLLLPTHVFTAPFVMTDARFREEDLRRVMHDS